MSSSTPLAQSFCTDLINHGVFKEAEALVRDTYKLQVEAKQSEKKFVITAVGTELLELAVHLLKSWLERKKKRNGDSIDDRIKDTKENPLLDISVGYVIWIFWGELGSKLLSEDWKKEAEKIKFVESPSVTIYRNPEKKTLCVTCNFECFEAVKKKVENLIRQVTSGISGLPSLDKSQKSESNNGYKGKGQSGIDGSKGKYMDGTVRQLKGASREYKLPPPHLGGKENGSTRMPHSSASKDESSETDKQSLFCTKNFKIKVFVYEASIVSLSGIDAIVNAANEHLSHGGGVPYHISKAAGGDKSSLEIECHNYIKKNKKVYVTKNFTSSAGNMPYKGVIHAVGPMWTEYKAKDECAKDLCMTIINVLIEADKKKFSKIAVPAISSGIYGVPKKLCAEMYIRGVIDYDRVNLQTCVREIHFVDIAKDILQEISNAYERWKQNDNNINFKNANIYSSVSEKELPVHKSDGGQRNVVNLSGICSFDKCKRKGEKRCKNCCKVVCTLCIMDVDSSETQCPFCKKNFNLENKKTREEQQEELDIPSDEVDNCPICMETLTSPKMLPCGHKFHAECIDQSLKYKKTCPICGIVVGALTGYQPPGLMHYNILKDITPPGFEKCGTIEIFYDFPDGFQEEDHPHPGMPYQGTHRRAFLPNNTEGQKVFKLLQVAFDRKLIFTIGESRITGKKNIVTWNGIHHKTKIDGGPTNFGYPDETYLKRVQEELADKGVTEKDITDNGVTEKDITDKGVTEKDIRGSDSCFNYARDLVTFSTWSLIPI